MEVCIAINRGKDGWVVSMAKGLAQAQNLTRYALLKCSAQSRLASYEFGKLSFFRGVRLIFIFFYHLFVVPLC